jgi:hypothetical protein
MMSKGHSSITRKSTHRVSGDGWESAYHREEKRGEERSEYMYIE